MSGKISITDVTLDTVDDYGLYCVKSPKNEGYQMKRHWLEKRFKEGLKIKQIVSESDGKTHAYIEYIPGEYAWRTVDAKGYYIIHCLTNWYKADTGNGYASRLLQACIDDAKKAKMSGVAVVTSEKPFLTGSAIFKKNGFSKIDESDNFELWSKELKKDTKPKFKDWQKQLLKYKGINIIYTGQCTMIAKSVREIEEAAKKDKIKINFVELKTAKDAQNAPSPFTSFCVVKDGKLISDRYMSKTKFMSEIKKHIK